MNKYDFRVGNSEQATKPKRDKYDNTHCEVYGCPRAGHIYTTSWNCRYHHGRAGNVLARITLMLKTHATEIDWSERLQNMTEVDFVMGDVKKNAPCPLEVEQGETWRQYKARVASYVDDLFGIAKPRKDRHETEQV